MKAMQIIENKAINPKSFQDFLGGILDETNGITTLIFNNEKAKGNIRFLALNDGLISININIKLAENFHLGLGHKNTETLFIMFCLSGNCQHAINLLTPGRTLDQLQTAVIKTNTKTGEGIILGKGVQTVLNIIVVDKDLYFQKNVNALYLPKTKLIALFKTLNMDRKHIHFGTYNIKIGDYVKDLLVIKEKDQMTELLRYEGLSYLILASHLEQLQQEVLQIPNKSTLSGTELKKIHNIAAVIKNNPQEQYTINTLCKLTYLSPAKLQEGFKALNGRTISEIFISVVLIRCSDL